MDSTPPRILVADDAEDQRRLLTFFLDKFPARVDAVSNGSEAVERCRTSGAYDLFLIDGQMPVMDGYEAVSKIRALFPAAPIVLITAEETEREKERAREAGCAGYLSKPISRDRLYAECRRLLPGSLAQEGSPVSLELKALLPIFFERRAADLETIRKALVSGDYAAIRAVGHRIKGSGASYGFPDLGEIGRALEAAAISNDASAIEEAAGRLERRLKVKE